MLLHLLAIVRSLYTHFLEYRSESLFASTNNKALSMYVLASRGCSLLDDIDEVDNLSSVAHIIDSMIDEHRQLILPFSDWLVVLQIGVDINLIDVRLWPLQLVKEVLLP